MANYSNLQAAIASGLSNMTVLRNHSRNDDGTSTYATGIDWFKFNNAVVSNIYSSGNSWIGFGASSEQLKVNRRDCAVWDEFKETGTIAGCKFFKFTWKGTSAYSSSYERVDSYQQYFDLFLFDNGQMYLNFYKVPTSDFSGTNALVCGSQTVNYSVSAGVPCAYTFTPSDATSGTGWSVSTNEPDIYTYKPSGTAVINITSYTAGGGDTLIWNASTPSGTSLAVYTKVNNGSYRRCENGSPIAGMVRAGQTCSLSIKIELETSNVKSSPSISSMVIKSEEDMKVLIITLRPPNISNAIGNVTIGYDGLGGLRGRGGPSSAFSGSFTPTGLTWKGHQNDEEHIRTTITARRNLIAITFHNTREQEHVMMSVTAVATLTHIQDI